MNEKLIDFYERAQIATAMDCGIYVGGTEHYALDRAIEGMVENGALEFILPPRLTYLEMCVKLTADGRFDEIEYLMD